MSPAAATILVFDWGLKQIGVAAGNTETRTCQPLPILHAKDGRPDWQQLAKILDDWQPKLLLVGEPLNMDGSPGVLHQRADKFARRLHGRFGLPYKLVDERLSSYAAKAELKEQGHRGNYHNKPADSLAAVLIFETWLEQEAR